MTEYLILKLAHLLLFVYWLGGDLGTFYGSRFVANAALGKEARITAAKIMMGVDMAPRLCMPLILPSGVQMAAMGGWMPLPEMGLTLMWLVCLAWIAMVLAVHHYSGKPLGALIGRIDFWFRIVGVVFLGAIAIYAISTGNVIPAGWVAIKLLIFTGTVICGLMIRIQLKPFGPAFGRLAAHGADAETDRIIASAIARCKPFVMLIWLGLILCAALGLHLV